MNAERSEYGASNDDIPPVVADPPEPGEQDEEPSVDAPTPELPDPEAPATDVPPGLPPVPEDAHQEEQDERVRAQIAADDAEREAEARAAVLGPDHPAVLKGSPLEQAEAAEARRRAGAVHVVATTPEGDKLAEWDTDEEGGHTLTPAPGRERSAEEVDQWMTATDEQLAKIAGELSEVSAGLHEILALSGAAADLIPKLNQVVADGGGIGGVFKAVMDFLTST